MDKFKMEVLDKSQVEFLAKFTNAFQESQESEGAPGRTPGEFLDKKKNNAFLWWNHRMNFSGGVHEEIPAETPGVIIWINLR